jgi:hypothetical protein
VGGAARPEHLVRENSKADLQRGRLTLAGIRASRGSLLKWSVKNHP